jgi:hypothetical protein
MTEPRWEPGEEEQTSRLIRAVWKNFILGNERH